MYSDRQTELSIFLEQVQQSAEEKTKERVIIHAVSKADGEKIFEIIIGENPLFAPVVCVEASDTGYRKCSLDDVLQGFWTVYDRYKKLDKEGFPFDEMKASVYLRLVPYERYSGFLDNLIYRRFLDLAVVPVLVLEVSTEDRCFSLAVNIQKGMCDVGEKELFQTASENTKKDCMVKGVEFSAEESGYEIFAMSNGHHSAILDTGRLRDLAKEIYSSFLYIVPVSIYEVLVIPEDNVFDLSELQEFSRNRKELLDFEEAVLSERVYRYSLESGDINFI